MTNQELAGKILAIVGPKSNVIQATNCMTRLRLILQEESFDYAALQALEGVKGVNKQGTELQIILGPGKAGQVTTAFTELLRQEPETPPEQVAPQWEDLHQQVKAKNATPFKLFLKKIAHIFMPLIPAFIGCGLITGILNIALKIEPHISQEPLVQVLALAGNAVFWGLNLFVGINAAHEFGGTAILGGVMGAILAHPGLAKITLWGEPLLPGRGGIIAVVLVVAFTAWLEKKLHKIVPEMLDLFLTPLLAVSISTFVAVVVLQPLGGMVSEAIGTAATVAVAKGGAVTGFILGGTFLPLVMTGIHQGLTPIHAELLSRYGETILLPILAMAGGGQVGAVAAIYVRTKNVRLKKTIASCLPVGLMGVGEPLIYGVTLPLGKPFIGACLGGACGGAVQAFAAVGASALGLSGLPLAASTNNIPMYLLGLLASYVGGFIATLLIGFDDPEESGDINGKGDFSLSRHG